jgi:hypothetical protein
MNWQEICSHPALKDLPFKLETRPMGTCCDESSVQPALMAASRDPDPAAPTRQRRSEVTAMMPAQR